MHHEMKKVTVIVTEMMTMLMLNGAREIDIKIKRTDIGTEFTFTHYDCHYDEDFIDRLEYNLNTQRQYEVEGYYWQLAGEDESGDELHLVGAMIDEAEIKKDEENLHIHLIRRTI